MKKNIIALAIASAVAAPAAFAGAPTVYGKINMSVDSGKWEGTDEGVQVNSVASRIGVKGNSDLGNGLKTIYKMEFGVNVDNTDNNGGKAGTGLTGRNSYVGLAGGFGTVLLGRHDTPMKMSQAKDLFNDGYGDAKPMAGDMGVGGKAGEVRASNVLAYISPSFNGTKVVLAAVPYEDGKDSSITDVISAAVMYGSKKKGLYVGGAYNKFTARTGSDSTELRVSAQYKTGPLLANVMYQTFDKTAVDGSNIQVNLGYKVGAATLKAKYSVIDYKTGSDSNGTAVGVDYSLGKKTATYVEYVSIDKKAQKYGDSSIMSVGLVHKF